jgi:hypothetical protein
MSSHTALSITALADSAPIAKYQWKDRGNATMLFKAVGGLIDDNGIPEV